LCIRKSIWLSTSSVLSPAIASCSFRISLTDTIFFFDRIDVRLCFWHLLIWKGTLPFSFLFLSSLRPYHTNHIILKLLLLLFAGRGDYFWFGSVFIKKNNQTEIFFWKKNRNRVKPTGFGSVRFGFFRAKTGSNRFGSVFPVLAQFSWFWLGFFRFWLGFFRFFLVFCRFRFGSVFSVFCL